MSVVPGAQALSGGNAVPDGSYRFLARLTTGEGGCSGALIDPEFVMTTAACLPETGEVKIVVGDVNLATGAGHVTKAAKIVRHPSRELLARVKELLAMNWTQLADPEATSRELRRLRDELDEEQPEATPSPPPARAVPRPPGQDRPHVTARHRVAGPPG